MLRRLKIALYRPLRRIPRPARRFLIRRLAPCFTVGAVCRIERPPDGAVLLITQAYRNHWGLPGGLLRRGEEPADAAVREVREELGVDVVLEGEPVVVFDAVPRRIDFVFRGGLAPGTGDPAPRSAEIVDARWFAPDALPSLQLEAAAGLTAVSRPSGGR